jgi:hypothetical protein
MLQTVGGPAAAQAMPFLRFLVREKDPVSHQAKGLFRVAYELRDAARLGRAGDGFDALSDWFTDHLRIPGRFSRYQKPNSPQAGICWFKDTARTHLACMRALAALVESCGVPVYQVHTRKPGYVLYEDRHQVVAVPFRDTWARRALRRAAPAARGRAAASGPPAPPA